jgi:hypothetical protein
VKHIEAAKTNVAILPVQVQVDNESWTPVSGQNVQQTSWTTTFNGRI